MNILYIGAFSVKQITDKYPDYGLDTYKTSEFLLKGFSQIEDLNLRVITSPDVGSYPRFPELIIKRIVDNNGIISTGFINIMGLKRFIIIHNLYKEAVNIINNNSEKTYVIIPYMVAHYVRIARKLKRRFGDKVHICQIIPDIFFISSKLSPSYWLNKYAERAAVKSDSFVLFTRAMADYLGIEEGKYIVMESLIDGDTYLNQVKEQHVNKDKIRVVYTGALRKDNGVDKLIEIMSLIKRTDFGLWITGRGAFANAISEAAKLDARIHFLGTVSKDEVFKCQSEADILINPRSDNDASKETRYMFPSKLMEYMLTGNAVLTCRMSGIPEEYYNYVYVAEDDTPKGLAESLESLLKLNEGERASMGKSARQYILDNKTYSVQTRRIVELLKKNSNI